MLQKISKKKTVWERSVKKSSTFLYGVEETHRKCPFLYIFVQSVSEKDFDVGCRILTPRERKILTSVHHLVSDKCGIVFCWCRF